MPEKRADAGGKKKKKVVVTIIDLFVFLGRHPAAKNVKAAQ